MYLSRPPISVSSDPQLAKKNTNSQKARSTTLMVRDRDDMVRHPATKKFTSRWQNSQSSGDYADDQATSATERDEFTDGNRKGV
jgi:hypothetical protein